MQCDDCGYDGLGVEYEAGQPFIYDEQDDFFDEHGHFAGYGLPITACPKCNAPLVYKEDYER